MGPSVLVTFQSGQLLKAVSLIGPERAAHRPGHESAGDQGTGCLGKMPYRRVALQVRQQAGCHAECLTVAQGANWLLSSAHRSSPTSLFSLKVLKEPTKMEEVPPALEEGAQPPPWEICLLVAFLCCEQQARGTQQVRGHPDWLSCDLHVLRVWTHGVILHMPVVTRFP